MASRRDGLIRSRMFSLDLSPSPEKAPPTSSLLLNLNTPDTCHIPRAFACNTHPSNLMGRFSDQVSSSADVDDITIAAASLAVQSPAQCKMTKTLVSPITVLLSPDSNVFSPLDQRASALIQHLTHTSPSPTPPRFGPFPSHASPSPSPGPLQAAAEATAAAADGGSWMLGCHSGTAASESGQDDLAAEAYEQQRQLTAAESEQAEAAAAAAAAAAAGGGGGGGMGERGAATGLFKAEEREMEERQQGINNSEMRELQKQQQQDGNSDSSSAASAASPLCSTLLPCIATSTNTHPPSHPPSHTPSHPPSHPPSHARRKLSKPITISTDLPPCSSHGPNPRVDRRFGGLPNLPSLESLTGSASSNLAMSWRGRSPRRHAPLDRSRSNSPSAPHDFDQDHEETQQDSAASRVNLQVSVATPRYACPPPQLWGAQAPEEVAGGGASFEMAWDEGDDFGFCESPITPSTVLPAVALECPDAPSNARNREMVRNSSLKDTKLLLTTQLKRSQSTFLFDRHFEFLKEIGRGSFSKVFEARDRRGGALCAIKVSKREFGSREERERFMHEVQCVANLSEHPNIVRYYRGWQQDSHFYIQMELCEGGSLRALLDSLKAPLPEEKVWEYIKQMAAGLAHLHAQGVLHLDIKPDNILIDSNGTLKIGDFGTAVLEQKWEWEEGDGGYLAPELLRSHQEPKPAADMYSFGALVFECASFCRLPRSGLETREGSEHIAKLAVRSEPLQRLVCSLLSSNPEVRPTAMEVVNWRIA